MRSYKEMASFLITREQLALGWRITFFIVCGALVFGSGLLWRINVKSVEMIGTVISHGAEPTDEGHNPYLVVRLDNGETVRVRPSGALDFRPGQRGIVREVTTNFFGLKKHLFKGYLDKPPVE